MKNTELSVVVPCYNEEEGIKELLKRLNKVCLNLKKKYEIILVDDGSKDDTWNEIKKHIDNNSSIKGIKLSRNFGHQYALSAGLSNSSGDKIFIIDADLQDPPELLPEMLKIMKKKEADVVYGKRKTRLGESWFKLFTAKFFYKLLSSVSDITIHRDTGDFRLINRKVLEAINSFPEHVRFMRGLFSWVGFKQVPIEYIRKERFAGKSNYPLSKMLKLAIDAITGFSVKPLRLAFIFGIISAFFGLLTLMYVFYIWYHFNTVNGWTSIISLILIMSSAQFILLGLIGEYVGRIFMESKKRPHFIISEIYSKK